MKPFFDTWYNRTRRFMQAFQDVYVTTNILDNENFDDYNARLLRYAIYFSFYENTTYNNVHAWSVTYRTRYAMYKYTRNLYNPAYRLAEFWRTVLWGGILDLEGGETGAIPIRTTSATLRKAVAQCWRDSDFDMTKDILTLHATTMGDAGIKIVDSPEKKKVYLKCIHPSNIRDVVLDFRGNVKGYVLEEQRTVDNRDATYVEVCERGVGDNIVYTTYKDGEPYAWNGVQARWTVPYGFVPFVLLNHNRVGGKWGWAEMHPQSSRMREVDEAASKMHDYLRKAIDPVWLFNFKKPRKAVDLQAEGATASESSPLPGREEIPALYVSDVRAKAQPLVTDLVNVEHAAGTIKALIAEMERELPELQMDIWTAGGYTTGTALRTARQRVEKKVIQRRPNYDKPLVRANQMVLAISGERNYPGFEDYSLTSFENGDLDHEIRAERPVFDTDALEAVERKQVFWRTVIEAVSKNIPVEPILADHGWSETRIADFVSKLPEPVEEEALDNPDEQSDDQGDRDEQMVTK